MSLYAFEIWSPEGELVADLTGIATSRTIKAGRNEAEEIKFSVDADALKAVADGLFTTTANILSIGRNEVRVRRGDNYLVGGRIDYAVPTLSREDRDIAITANGFLNMFADRFVVIPDGELTKVFTADDAAQILWDIIDESQSQGDNWDFGVTQGTLQTIGNKDRTYDRTKNIKDAIVQMTEVTTSSMDIEFTHEKVFNAYTRLGSDLPEVILRYPGNVLPSSKIPMDAKAIKNHVTVLGSGLGAQATVESIEQDVPSQINNKVRQKILQMNSVQEEDTLSDHGEAEIQAGKDPLILPQLSVDLNGTVSIEDFWVGDSVKVEIDDPAIPASIVGMHRIERINLTIDDEDGESATLTMRQ